MDKDINNDLSGNYTSNNCYLWVGSDGTTRAKSLYEGTNRVLTGITSTMIADALGYTPANRSTYLPLSAGDSYPVSGTLNVRYRSDRGVQIIPGGDPGIAFTSSGQWMHLSANGGLLSIYNGEFDPGGTGNHGAGINIATTNNIGIGIQSPSYKLDVSGSLNATTIYQNGVALGARAFDSTSYLPLSGGILTGEITYQFGSTSSDQWIRFKDSTGSEEYCLGIKKQYSTYGLTLYDGSYWRIYSEKNANRTDTDWSCNNLYVAGTIRAAGTTRPIYGFDDNGTSYGRMASFSMIPDNDSNDAWQVRPLNGSYTDAYITVLHGGNVGIGTYEPSQKLDVSGNVKITGNIYFTGNSNVFYHNTRPFFGVEKTDSHTAWTSYMILPDNDADDAWQVRKYGGNYSNAIITVKQSGYVGIGTTSPSYALHVVGNSYYANKITAAGDIESSSELKAPTVSSTVSLNVGSSSSADINLLRPSTNYITAASEGGIIAFRVNGDTSFNAATIGTTGNLTVYGSIIKSGGTSSQFLKADGSLDSTTYAPAGNYAVRQTGNDLCWHTDEFSFLPSGFSSTNVWFNYRTVGDPATSNFTYLFANGKADGGYAPIRCGNITSGTINATGTSITAGTTITAGSSIFTSGGFKSYSGNFLNVYSPGSGTYNILTFSVVGTDHVELECPWTENNTTTGTKIPFYIGWRGGDYPICLSSNSQVGIGTRTPTQKLDVNGNLNVSGDIYTTGSIHIPQSGGIYMSTAGTSARKIYGCDSSNNSYTRMASYAMLPDNDSDDCWQVRPWNGGFSDSYITVKHGGNVGIGTTSPSYKFQVNGTIYADTGAGRSVKLLASGDPGICITSAGQWIHFCGDGGLVLLYNGAYDPSGKANWKSGFVINGSNNVGLGTSSPSYKLDVNGSFNATSIYLNGTQIEGTLSNSEIDAIII